MIPDHRQKQIADACVTVVNQEARGRGGLVPGNLLLTAARCVHYSVDGAMAVGNYFIQTIETRLGRLKVQPLAVEPCLDIALLGALQGPGFYEECCAYEEWCAHTLPIPSVCETFHSSSHFLSLSIPRQNNG